MDFEILQTLKGSTNPVDVSYMAIFNFYEKEFVLNDTNLILRKPLFSAKNTKLRKFYVLTITLLPVFKIA